MSSILWVGPILGGTVAYVAEPETTSESKKAIILLHEWWGLTDNIKEIADAYAEEGFIAIAPDLYHLKTTKDPERAKKLMENLSSEDAVKMVTDTVTAARDKFGLNHFGITGFCMGGTHAFQSACTVEGISAAVVFYGDVPADDVLKKLTVPTVFISGKKDQWINTEMVSKLVEFSTANQLPVDSVAYDADHAFFNKTRKEVFDKAAAEDAWAKTISHFNDHL